MSSKDAELGIIEMNKSFSLLSEALATKDGGEKATEQLELFLKNIETLRKEIVDLFEQALKIKGNQPGEMQDNLDTCLSWLSTMQHLLINLLPKINRHSHGCVFVSQVIALLSQLDNDLFKYAEVPDFV